MKLRQLLETMSKAQEIELVFHETKLVRDKVYVSLRMMNEGYLRDCEVTNIYTTKSNLIAIEVK